MYFVNLLVKERSMKHSVQKVMSNVFHHQTEGELKTESRSKEKLVVYGSVIKLTVTEVEVQL